MVNTGVVAAGVVATYIATGVATAGVAVVTTPSVGAGIAPLPRKSAQYPTSTPGLSPAPDLYGGTHY